MVVVVVFAFFIDIIFIFINEIQTDEIRGSTGSGKPLVLVVAFIETPMVDILGHYQWGP